jgi:hypothetical protein
MKQSLRFPFFEEHLHACWRFSLQIFGLTFEGEVRPVPVGMNISTPTELTASSLPAGKITRKQLAVHCGLSLRTIDELTRNAVLPVFKIGKAVRYELAEVEAALRERFHIRAKARKANFRAQA